jgi:hypothetical protein
MLIQKHLSGRDAPSLSMRDAPSLSMRGAPSLSMMCRHSSSSMCCSMPAFIASWTESPGWKSEMASSQGLWPGVKFIILRFLLHIVVLGLLIWNRRMGYVRVHVSLCAPKPCHQRLAIQTKYQHVKIDMLDEEQYITSISNDISIMVKDISCPVYTWMGHVHVSP